MNGKVRADLMNYFLPGRTILRKPFTLEKISNLAGERGIGIVGITAFSDKGDGSHDTRGRYFLGHKGPVEISKDKEGRRIIILTGQNGPTINYTDKECSGGIVRLCRIGEWSLCPPGESTEEAIESAENLGKIILADSIGYKNLGSLKDKIHGVSWNAEFSRDPRRTNIQEKTRKNLEEQSKEMVALSGAHVPYCGWILDSSVPNFGRAYIIIDLETIKKDKFKPYDLIGEMQEKIITGDFISRYRPVSWWGFIEESIPLYIRTKVPPLVRKILDLDWGMYQ